MQVVRNSTLVQVKLNGTEYFRKSISAAKQLDAQVSFSSSSPDASAPCAAALTCASRQVLYLGGPPPLPPPGNATAAPAAAAQPSTPAPAHGAHDDANYFKGVIQDVQVCGCTNTKIVNV